MDMKAEEQKGLRRKHAGKAVFVKAAPHQAAIFLVRGRAKLDDMWVCHGLQHQWGKAGASVVCGAAMCVLELLVGCVERGYRRQQRKGGRTKENT